MAPSKKCKEASKNGYMKHTVMKARKIRKSVKKAEVKEEEKLVIYEVNTYEFHLLAGIKI